jgi:hypothetical protein
MMAHAPRMLRLFGMPLICLTLFALSGGHWAVFQGIAWAQMIRDYSKTGTIAEAIAKTFNGRFPCGMCTKISEKRQKESSAPATVKFEKKGEIFLVAVRPYPQRPGGKDYRYFDLDDATPTKRSHAPPAPVPRLS